MSLEDKRHHDERMKRRVRSYYGGRMTTPKRIGRCAATRTPCSCWMCGNARRHAGTTLQERIADIAEREHRNGDSS